MPLASRRLRPGQVPEEPANLEARTDASAIEHETSHPAYPTQRQLATHIPCLTPNSVSPSE